MLTNFLIVKAFVAHVDCQRRSCHFSLLGRNQRWLADAFCSAHNICAHLLCWVSSLLICFDCLGCSDSVLCIAIENCQNTWLVVHMNGGYSVFNNHPQPTNFVSYFTPVEEDKYQKDSFHLLHWVAPSQRVNQPWLLLHATLITLLHTCFFVYSLHLVGMCHQYPLTPD